MVSELNILLERGPKSPRKKSFFLCADFALFCVEELVRSISYYTRGALRTGGECRASIVPAWIRHVDARTRVCVDAWTRGRVDAWTRGCVNRPIF